MVEYKRYLAAGGIQQVKYVILWNTCQINDLNAIKKQNLPFSVALKYFKNYINFKYFENGFEISVEFFKTVSI